MGHLPVDVHQHEPLVRLRPHLRRRAAVHAAHVPAADCRAPARLPVAALRPALPRALQRRQVHAVVLGLELVHPPLQVWQRGVELEVPLELLGVPADLRGAATVDPADDAALDRPRAAWLAVAAVSGAAFPFHASIVARRRGSMGLRSRARHGLPLTAGLTGELRSERQTEAMDVKRMITYTGPTARARGVADALEEEGLRVEWTPAEERRGIDYSADTQAAVVAFVVYGGQAAIQTAVKKIRAWAPWAKVELEGEQPDDGGFMDPPPE